MFGEILPKLSRHLGSAELEVFHHHSAVVQANWKFWNDNNTEVYQVVGGPSSAATFSRGGSWGKSDCSAGKLPSRRCP